MTLGIAEDIIIRAQPEQIPIAFAKGSCALALTSSPFAMMPPGANCWVLLADWLPADAPVGMFVSFLARHPAGASARILDVHSVAAVDGMRGNRDEDGDTVPVLLGRWLFKEKLLTRHSPDRTPAVTGGRDRSAANCLHLTRRGPRRLPSEPEKGPRSVEPGALADGSLAAETDLR
jgi:hypothetical protein